MNFSLILLLLLGLRKASERGRRATAVVLTVWLLVGLLTSWLQFLQGGRRF